MLKWDNVKFYQDKFFQTCIDLYFCDGRKLCEHQPWKPWTDYKLIPARSHIHITSVKKIKVATYFGLGSDEKGVVVMGTLPPWIMKPIDVTNIIYKNETRHTDILRLDRALSYSHETNGRPWLTPALRPTYLDVLR